MTDKLPRLWVFSTDNDVATAREMAERIKAEAISERDAELARLRAELEKEKARSSRIMADFRKVLRWDGHGQFFNKAVLDARIAERDKLRAELEQAKSDVERWSSSSGFFSDSLAMANESAAVLQAERDKYAASLVEIRGICTSMMDGWGQTVEVLDRIRKITYGAIKRQPTEPPHTPETFA